jgi:ACS family tartrate transporter-like MFS transporter
MSVVIGRRSDKTGERTVHIVIPGVIGAIGFLVAATSSNLVIGGIGIIFAAIGIWVSNTLAWSLPPKYLTGAALATGIALINAVGNLGGFFGPFMVGWLNTITGGYQVP